MTGLSNQKNNLYVVPLVRFLRVFSLLSTHAGKTISTNHCTAISELHLPLFQNKGKVAF